MAEIKNVGFIGLGIMGKPMAKNLIKAGFKLTVHDLLRSPVEEMVAAGASAASSSSRCAERADAVVTMLPDSPDSELVILGSDGVLEGARQAHRFDRVRAQLLDRLARLVKAASRQIGDLIDGFPRRPRIVGQ